MLQSIEWNEQVLKTAKAILSDGRSSSNQISWLTGESQKNYTHWDSTWQDQLRYTELDSPFNHTQMLSGTNLDQIFSSLQKDKKSQINFTVVDKMIASTKIKHAPNCQTKWDEDQ